MPLRPRSKHPAVKNWQNVATDDLVQVFQWWEGPHRGANVALVCNPSDLVVLDVDPRNGGDDTFAEAERALGRLPHTVSAVTGGGGAHYYFIHPGGPLRGKLGDGLDVKDHGYVLLSPSVHPDTGRPYEWDEHPDETEVAHLPRDWVDALEVTMRRMPERDPSAPASNDPLRRIPAAQYVHQITGRDPDARGFYRCPFHGGGNERTPSLKVDGHMWACYGCPATGGKRCAGGNIYDFMALTLELAVPPKGIDYLIVKDRLKALFR
jgi:hypothetical protein